MKDFIIGFFSATVSVFYVGIPLEPAVPLMEMTLLCQTISDLLAVGALGEDLGAFQIVLELLHRHADFLLLPGNMEALMNIQTALNHTIDISPSAYDFFIRENLYNMELVPYLDYIAKIPESLKTFNSIAGNIIIHALFGILGSSATRIVLELLFGK